MQNFLRWHRITAAAVFLIAMVLYLLTMAPTTSFWDCGEFIACSRTLSVPHPPGAPFYLLLGRLFSLLPSFGDVGARINLISPLTSALTVLLLYLTVIHLIRYWKKRQNLGLPEILGAAVGALAFMGTDTFWFNAVEAEVYAISMLFTALVVWLAFVWHDLELRGHHGGDRIFLLIFYIIGLAIGVHLLNVLALPLVFLVIYFHWSDGQPLKTERFLLFWALSILAILPVFPGVVLWLPKLFEVGGAAGGPLLLALLLVGLGWLHWWGKRNNHRLVGLGSAALLLVIIGYFSYVIILLRSGLNPPLDENDPETIAGLIRYLGREQYGSESIVSQLLDRKAPLWDYQIRKMYLRYFGWNFIGRDIATGVATFAQLWGLPLLTGLWGLVHHFSRDWKRAFSITNLFLLTGLAIVIYLNQDDPQPRERDYAYVCSFYAFAIWIGVGAAALLEDLARLARKAARPAVWAGAGLLVLLLPLRIVSSNYYSHDRSENFVAWDYARNSLAMLEQDAIIFTNGDNDTFPLWYQQIVEKYREDVRVVNLSLLNTGWYIRQLRDEPPTVPIPKRFTDSFIAGAIDGHGQEAFEWRYWGPEIWQDRSGVPLPKDRRYKVPFRNSEGEIYRIEVRPTMHVPLGDGSTEDNFLRVQDRMILEIIRENRWKRPIYFAVTVATQNFAGLDGQLRMDGLAYRVMDRPADYPLEPEVIGAAIEDFEEYFRGLDTEGIFFDDNIQKLVQNYRSAYIQLALEEEARGNGGEALRLLRRMDRFLPERVVPSYATQLSLQLGLLFERLGDPEGLEQRLRLAMERPEGLSFEDRFSVGAYWLDPLKNLEQGLSILEPLTRADQKGEVAFEVALALEQGGFYEQARLRYQLLLEEHPDKADAVAALIRIYEREKQYEEARDLVIGWLEQHPQDPTARRRLDRYEKLLKEAGEGER